jgi:hypothetical protein
LVTVVYYCGILSTIVGHCTAVHAKWPKLMLEFIKTLNETFWSKTNTFLGFKFQSHFGLLPHHYVGEQTLLLKVNIGVTYFELHTRKHVHY